MENTPLEARVNSIQLTDFFYDRNFNPKESTLIHYEVEIDHMVPKKSTRLDVSVTIRYFDKSTESSEPILSGSCLTIYQLENTKVEKNTLSVSKTLVDRLLLEAVAHARAVIAIQTAATPFGNTHVELRSQIDIGNVPVSETE